MLGGGSYPQSPPAGYAYAREDALDFLSLINLRKPSAARVGNFSLKGLLNTKIG